METPFWAPGAAESMNIGIIVIGASNKSGRRCKPSDEINLIYLMHLDLSVTKRCSFWRHGFRKQVLLSRWKYVKTKLERPINQGDVNDRCRWDLFRTVTVTLIRFLALPCIRADNSSNANLQKEKPSPPTSLSLAEWSYSIGIFDCINRF